MIDQSILQSKFKHPPSTSPVTSYHLWLDLSTIMLSDSSTVWGQLVKQLLQLVTEPGLRALEAIK